MNSIIVFSLDIKTESIKKLTEKVENEGWFVESFHPIESRSWLRDLIEHNKDKKIIIFTNFKVDFQFFHFKNVEIYFQKKNGSFLKKSRKKIKSFFEVEFKRIPEHLTFQGYWQFNEFQDIVFQISRLRSKQVIEQYDNFNTIYKNLEEIGENYWGDIAGILHIWKKYFQSSLETSSAFWKDK